MKATHFASRPSCLVRPCRPGCSRPCFRALCGLFRLVGLGRCLGRLLFSGTAVGDLLLVFRDEAVGGFQRIHLDALLAQAVGGAGLQVVKGHVGHAVEVIE